MTTTNERRERAATMCAYHAAAAERFAARANDYAAAGRLTKAWTAADFADDAATCAMQEHEELWDAAGGELTDDEFEAFEAAERARTTARAAAKAAAAAVARAQAAYDAAH